MSEYQYYEFQATDKPLTEKECSIVSDLSSRAIVSPTHAIFTYSYSDFRGDPEKLLFNYFDAMLYMANWGTRQIYFKFPKDLIKEDEIKRYCIPHAISLIKNRKYFVLNITCNNEDDHGWVEGEGYLSSIIPLRQDILKGDYRMLYLSWLHAMSQDAPDDNILEPPVPSNLSNLNDSPLNHFIEFMGINRQLVAAAAENNHSTSIKTDTLETHIQLLSEEEKIDFLKRLLKGEAYMDVKLEKLTEPKQKTVGTRRTLDALLKRAEELEQELKEREYQQKEKMRINALKKLAKNETATWDSIEKLVRIKTSKSYEDAIKKLAELKELAIYTRKMDVFSTKVEALCEEFQRSHSFIKKVQSAKIIERV
jgi:hypothetical protein